VTNNFTKSIECASHKLKFKAITYKPRSVPVPPHQVSASFILTQRAEKALYTGRSVLGSSCRLHSIHILAIVPQPSYNAAASFGSDSWLQQYAYSGISLKEWQGAAMHLAACQHLCRSGHLQSQLTDMPLMHVMHKHEHAPLSPECSMATCSVSACPLS
jgi:hypothetical protein